MSTDLTYPLAPLVGYLVAGSLKFALNSMRAGAPAFAAIGLGGAVSTHTTIVATTAWLVALKEGFDTAYFGIALTLAVIVMIDALDLRRAVGRQASALKSALPGSPEIEALRERLGHRPVEVLAGIGIGLACAFFLSLF